MQQNFQRTGTDPVPISDAKSGHVAIHPSKVFKFLKSSLIVTEIVTIKIKTLNRYILMLDHCFNKIELVLFNSVCHQT